MTILVTSDLHLNSKPRDRYRHEWMRGQLYDYAAGHNASTVAILGDLTDETDNHPASLVNEVADHIARLAKLCEDGVIIMRGNHDYVDEACPFFMFTKHIENVRWINKPTNLIISGTSALLLPHTHDWKRDWADVNFDKADVCFAHQTFTGASSESGERLSGLPLSAIPDDLMPVYSGDIHKRQIVGHVTYVGAPYTIDFGDDYKPRVLLLKSNGTVRSIACTGPQKRLITIDASTRAFKDALQHIRGDDIIKLRVTVPPGTQNWPGIKRDIMEEAQRLSVRLHAIEAVMSKPTATATKRYKVSSSPQRDDAVVRAYCKARSVDDPDTVAEGLEIIDSKETAS